MNSKLEIARQEPVWNTNKNIIYLILFIVAFLFVLPYLNTNSFYLHLMITIFMYSVMSQSWNVIAGMSGQISLGHGTFFGLGAYSSTFLYMEYSITPWVGIIVGIFLSSMVAILIGLSVLRLSGHYFAIATLLIGISFQVFFQRWDLIGAASGLWIPLTETDSWYAIQFHTSKIPYYYIFLIFFLMIFFLTWLLDRSKIGYRFRAVRDDPQAAASLGINVSKQKIIAYAISAMIMAPMGSLFAQYILIIDPDRVFSFDISIFVLLLTVLGGVGNIWGPLIGTVILIPITEYSRIWFGGTGGAVDLMIYGLILMLICVFRPAGIISILPSKILEREKKR